ncbi:MAG: alpha/beta hydrolase [Thermoguttaceae bacterium]|jgi:esterase/lipase superfamily enzyme
MNRSWTAAAVLGLAGISFLGGCGSERKANAPPAMPAPDAEKTATAAKVTSPGPEAADETSPASPVIKSQKPERDLGVQSLKRASPPKAMARPAQAPKIVSALPHKIEQENNPMRTTAVLPPETNPIRPGTSLAEEGDSVSAAHTSENTQILKGRKVYMEESEVEGELPRPTPTAMPDMEESSHPVLEDRPGATKPSNTETKAAPADLNEFLKMAQDQEGYTVVKVYYGTDRAAFSDVRPKQPVYLPWMIRTIVAAATALFLSLLGFRLFPSRLIRVLAYCGMFTTGVMAGLTIYARFQAPLSDDIAKTLPAASVAYGPERGKLELGTCEVSIPKSHEVGELESPSVLRLEFREDPNRHVVLLGIQPEPADRFFADLRECVGRSPQKSAFVFVHGYNVGFEDAARRTAQIAYDLKFEGAAIFFSWPSQAEILDYAVDETNVSWAAPHLLRFLSDVAEQSGAERIHLIAHSMGNRALTSALRDLSLMQKSDKPTFDEVVLTAPDIDADTFVNDIAPAVVKTARRVTLYSSSNDEALIVSKKVHGYPRAGDSGSQLVVLPGIDTVDVSAVDTSLLGHTYYGDNSTVLADIFELLNASKPADERHWLRPERWGLLKYWVFHQ